MKEQWIREGFSTYYVVKKEKSLTYEKEILLEHPLSCLLPCEFRMENEDVFYYYETGIYTLWKDNMNQMDGREFFYQMILAFEQMESYLLNLDHVKLTTDFVFLRKNGKPAFCYLPEFEENIFDQMRNFLEDSIKCNSHKERAEVRFYYEFHQYLVKEKPNMTQLKEYLMPRFEEEYEIQEEKAAESLMECIPQEETTVSQRFWNRDFAIWGLFGIALIILGTAAGYFLGKIFVYGWYYPVIAGFFLSVTLFFVVGVNGVRCWKRKKRCEEEIRDAFGEREDVQTGEKTVLLDHPTVLLTENVLGTLVLQKDGSEETISLENEFVIGSSREGTDYQLDEIGVSRRHVRFYQKQDDVICEDLQSTNGTRVNGKKIKEAVLNDGDWIQIGLEQFQFLRP